MPEDPMRAESTSARDLAMPKRKRSTAAQKKRRRERLYEEQDGKCYYCGCPTIIINYTKNPDKFPDNLATLEHLDNKLSKDRKPGEPARVVMACYRCNQERGAEDHKQHREQ